MLSILRSPTQTSFPNEILTFNFTLDFTHARFSRRPLTSTQALQTLLWISGPRTENQREEVTSECDISRIDLVIKIFPGRSDCLHDACGHSSFTFSICFEVFGGRAHTSSMTAMYYRSMYSELDKGYKFGKHYLTREWQHSGGFLLPLARLCVRFSPLAFVLYRTCIAIRLWNFESQQMTKKLETTEVLLWRKMQQTPWTDRKKKTNKGVLR